LASQTINTLAPTVTLTAIVNSDAGPGEAYDQGFTVTTGAAVSVKINGSTIQDSALADRFTVTVGVNGQDIYTAKVGQFDGSETIAVAARLSDAILQRVKLVGAALHPQHERGAATGGLDDGWTCGRSGLGRRRGRKITRDEVELCHSKVLKNATKAS
jgi:hypothetical protein